MKKVSKLDLQEIFDRTKDLYVNNTKPADLDGQQFIAKCYLESCIAYLGITPVKYEDTSYKEKAEE